MRNLRSHLLATERLLALNWKVSIWSVVTETSVSVPVSCPLFCFQLYVSKECSSYPISVPFVLLRLGLFFIWWATGEVIPWLYCLTHMHVHLSSLMWNFKYCDSFWTKIIQQGFPKSFSMILLLPGREGFFNLTWGFVMVLWKVWGACSPLCNPPWIFSKTHFLFWKFF